MTRNACPNTPATADVASAKETQQKSKPDVKRQGPAQNFQRPYASQFFLFHITFLS
jgi:hypothetical protein